MKKALMFLIILIIITVFSSCNNGESSVFANVTTFWKDVDRAGTEHSRQYVYSQTSILYSLYEEYIDPNMTEAQKTYLVARMRRIANEIPESEVPLEVLKVILRN